MRYFGIIGKPLAHSFSAQYFTEKFAQQHIDAIYTLYPLDTIDDFRLLLQLHDFTGMNVTLPYKEQIIPYLDALDTTAQAIGAVNVIRFLNGQLTGFNTDVIGFRNSLCPLLQPHHTHALVLGTGGAAKAVYYGLQTLGIEPTYVSRRHQQITVGNTTTDTLVYDQLNETIIARNTLIVNCTPLGMYPEVDTCAPIPYNLLTEQHLLYDVVYNPQKTLFLQRGEQQGCRIQNGLAMLWGQAEAAWRIWNRE
ncbi:MAG: shikimate dehydrogenase [Paludibacter sp.]|nr:shikimate dehydrogenase [Bacteroidales bacterium]MCM1069485.1 shikimate dehydrogenase [Prevotella sp.]MCM1354141.1 shikimate dehydrogenase [Bacteroides sp.]MCM1443002.1 shikimate dehydrogenase [Muribaculum sp.]MCM1482216.1 shikimate dehydrogenase [Paludibacter sp.]